MRAVWRLDWSEKGSVDPSSAAAAADDPEPVITVLAINWAGELESKFCSVALPICESDVRALEACK